MPVWPLLLNSFSLRELPCLRQSRYYGLIHACRHGSPAAKVSEGNNEGDGAERMVRSLLRY